MYSKIKLFYFNSNICNFQSNKGENDKKGKVKNMLGCNNMWKENWHNYNLSF